MSANHHMIADIHSASPINKTKMVHTASTPNFDMPAICMKQGIRSDIRILIADDGKLSSIRVTPKCP
jgi:hypothetical protein